MRNNKFALLEVEFRTKRSDCIIHVSKGQNNEIVAIKKLQTFYIFISFLGLQAESTLD